MKEQDFDICWPARDSEVPDTDMNVNMGRLLAAEGGVPCFAVYRSIGYSL